jgi:hypothetical protein
MARLLRRTGFVRAGLALAALALGGCALIVATGAAAGPGFSSTTPFTFGGTNPCTGDEFTGTGKLHLLISDNQSNSGNIQFHIEANFSGLQAVATLPLPGGKKYDVIDQEDLTQTFDSDGAPSHETVESTLQFVRSGEDGTLFPGDDFYEHFLAHITANANGVVTVEDVTTDSRCR